jgi:hypothetical protein
VDKLDQAEATDVFKWQRIPGIELERAVLLPGFDWAVGRHDGYARPPVRATHRRSVIFVKPEYWILVDEFAGSGQHSLQFNFHFPPGAEFSRFGNAWQAAKNGAHFRLIPLGALEWRVVTGETGPVQGWCSENYGHKEPAAALVGSTRVELPARFVTVLWPGENSPRLRLSSQDGLQLAVETDAWTDYLAASAQSGVKSNSEFSTDAEMAFLRRLASGEVSRAALVNGSSLQAGGRELVRTQSVASELEISRAGEVLEVYCQPEALSARMVAAGVRELRVNNRPTPFVLKGDGIEFGGLS